MAEDSWFWTTDGTGDGTDAGYTQAEVAQFWRYMFTQDPSTEFVVAGALNELATTGATSPVSMATGYAVVDGIPYKNDAAKDIAIATPVIGTTGHRIVLTADWPAQEVRQELLSSADGVAAIPAMTQTSGTDYDVSVCTLVITVGGDITVTDTRGFCHFGTDIETGMIETGAVTLAKMAVDSVDDSKAGNRIIQMHRRQGGNGASWIAPGTTTYTPGMVRMQVGAIQWTGGSAASGTQAVTYPTAFSEIPIVIATCQNHDDVVCNVANQGASAFRIDWSSVSSYTALDLSWIAIGTE